MQHKLPPLPVRIVVVLLVLSTIGYYAFRSLNSEQNGQLQASGTIESVTVNISPEMPGKVTEVLVEQGQPVKAGDPLLGLDDSLLRSQRAVAESGVESARSALLTAQAAFDMAQAQYDATLTAARAQQGSSRLTDWMGRAPGEFDQPLWYFSRSEQITAAQTEVNASRQALAAAQANFDSILNDLNNADFIAAETRVSDARVSYLVAKAVRDHAQVTGGKVSPEDIKVDLPAFAPSYRIRIDLAKKLSGESDVLNAANDALDVAEAELDDAQKAYDDLLTSESADQVLTARAVLSVAEERYQTALDTLSRLQTGEHAPQVLIAATALEQAKAGLQQAQTAVRQAEANLALLDTQLTKLTVYAPMDGVILTRNVEPGEFVQPGATAFALADLNNITITVYVPEDRLHEIKLGQEATVSIDSASEARPQFDAVVVHIADQAEFTPRNVQTVEGRSSTVFAIKLSISNNNGELKIGMPADVVFE